MRKTHVMALVATIVLASCQNQTEEKKEVEIVTEEQTESAMEEEQYVPLQDALNERKSNFNAKASDEKKRIYAEGLASIEESGLLDQALKVGDKAPNFSLKNATGQEVTLASYLEKGPVILTWYRGGWCPYCNLTLARLQEELPNFKAAGANLLALTPEVPDSSMTTAEKNNLSFEILSDLDNQVGKEYGIVFTLTDEVAEIYENGFGLSDYNGNNKSELPLAATYIIGQDGIITYAFLDVDYRNRAEPREIVNALNK